MSKIKYRLAKNLVPQETIENKIFLIRGEKVMLDKDLAVLYGIPTKSLNLAVKRNLNRFPEDFMFQLNKREDASLRFQFETSNRGGRRYLPYAFTEHGILMLSSVLNSERAVQVNIAIMRTFVKLKKMVSTNKELAHRLIELELRMARKDKEIQEIFQLIRCIIAEAEKSEPEKPKRRIGFHSN